MITKHLRPGMINYRILGPPQAACCDHGPACGLRNALGAAGCARTVTVTCELGVSILQLLARVAEIQLQASRFVLLLYKGRGTHAGRMHRVAGVPMLSHSTQLNNERL